MSEKIIKVKKAPQKTPQFNSEEIIATFCYHFPQYTYKEAEKMPFSRISKMLKVVRKERSKLMLDLLQVVSAPHTKDGKGIDELLQYHREILES